jgi:hypothetical protein
MEVHIGEVTSTVRATDGTALLSPEILQKIVAAVREQLKSDHDHDRRVAEERKLTPGVSHGEGGP